MAIDIGGRLLMVNLTMADISGSVGLSGQQHGVFASMIIDPGMTAADPIVIVSRHLLPRGSSYTDAEFGRVCTANVYVTQP